ncbi:trypsin-like peptidase domain-containing protein [Microbulbifer sp. S227A]|uniref:trypsin-like peptidase domain-containing protein n=1 Tax=Microbulbifer sp. S227A TaxID=3415131 RepID=UPI003C7BE95D
MFDCEKELLDRSRRARAFQGFGESPVPMLHPQSTGGALSDTTDVDSKHSRQQHDAALREFNRLNAEDYTEEDRERIEARLEYSRNSGTRSYEAIINTNDLDEYYFLSLGHEVGRAVGRVYVRGAQGGYGTGFLIAPGLLMTNNHVIPSRDAARLALVTFDHQLNADNTPLRAQHFQLSDALFMTSKALDYTIVKVAAHSTSGTPLEQYGYIELLPRSGKALKREHVCIIQHPGGNFKKVVVRGNEVVGRDELHLYYKSDTLPGSSGSPVFNTEWQIAALHHMAISDGTPDQGYVANRGIRISSILQDISRHRDMPGSDAEQIDAALQSVRSGPALPIPTSVPPVFLGAMADATEVRTPDPDDWAEGIGQTGSVLRAPEPESTRPSLSFTAASWPSNSKNAPDTWHLPSSAADATFDLNAELLQQIADTSHFVLHDGPLNTVIFALRGCRLADGTDMAEKRDDISLTTATVDHETPRCIIGVWHRASNQLSAYTGSTVPRRTEMKRYYDNVNFNIGSTLCNMLPTGCYEYCVGTHYSAKNGAVTYVLRQGDGPEPANRSTVTTLRTANDLTYGTWDIWDKCRPADNIHPGFIPGSFSSQGCLTLSGRQSGHGTSHTTGTGNWSRFRKSAGFDGKNHGETYPVLLITGHEAAAFAQAVDDNARAALSCLRHGSTGPQVAALQALVKSKQDGIFGPSTKLAVAELQYSKLSFATGSWNHEMEALLA